MNILYNKLLNLAKKGDRELFLENLEKILNLPNNLGDINFRDENGFSALISKYLKMTFLFMILIIN